MSKFIDNLKKACQAAPSPIGFLSRQSAPTECRMQVLAIVAPENLDKAVDFINGVDAVLLPVAGENPTKKRLAGFAGAAGNVPWGGWLKGKTAGSAELIKAGCDFVVFSGSNELDLGSDEKTGKIFEIDPSVTDTLLRAANNLPVDAVFINDESTREHTLTWQHLLQYQRYSILLSKPILVSIPAGITSRELKLLWEAGIDGAVVDAEQITAEEFKTLKKTLAETKFLPRGRRREKLDAVAPRASQQPAHPAHEEEDDDDE